MDGNEQTVPALLPGILVREREKGRTLCCFQERNCTAEMGCGHARGRGLAGGVLWRGITLGFRSHGSRSRAAREECDEEGGGGGSDYPLEVVHLLEQQ